MATKEPWLRISRHLYSLVLAGSQYLSSLRAKLQVASICYIEGDVSAYRQLNNQLRKGELSEFNQAFSELLSKGLSKIKPVEQTVYRTLRLNKTMLREYTEKAKEGMDVIFNGFTSSSAKKDVAISMAERHAGRKKNETDVLFVIKGKTGHPIEGLSHFSGRFEGRSNQYEVLFDKGTRFRFLKAVYAAGKMPIFYLQEI